MTRAEKRQHVWRLLKENATRSNREIARIAGVSHVAVGTMRKEFEADCETYHPVETYHTPPPVVRLSILLTIRSRTSRRRCRRPAAPRW
jgi:hypothetical protein